MNLQTWIPKHEYLICVDSDGSVFDTMGLKHGECFCPLFIDHFGLKAIEQTAKEAWEWVNLRSASRGIQRFRAIVKVMELLADAAPSFPVPRLEGLRAYVANGYPLHHAGMEQYLQQHPQAEDVRRALAWSRAVDERVAQKAHGAAPFAHAKEALEYMYALADIVVVSVTQREALMREWSGHGFLDFVCCVCGRESGNKRDILSALKGHYAQDHVLMIGDAPGDRDAALENGVLFYPICAGEEEASWMEFPSCFDAFVRGSYRSEKQDELLAMFEKILPTTSLYPKAGEKK